MKNYKIWGSLLLLLVLIILILTRIIDFSSKNSKTPEKIVEALGCTTCHGVDLAGSDKGPSILEMKKYWSKENLVRYLQNPAAFLDSSRLAKYHDQYIQYIMPSYDTVDVKTLGIISDYILNK